MRIFKESEDISSEKYSRAYYFYNNIFEVNIKKVIKIIIINAILRDRLNLIKKLFNVLIR